MGDAGILERLIRLLLAAWPGAFKILIFFLINILYGVETLGRIGAVLGVVQFFVVFASSGLTALLVVRLHKRESMSKYIGSFLIVSLPLSFLAHYFFSVGKVGVFFSIVFFWGVYLLLRALMMSLGLLRPLLLTECAGALVLSAFFSLRVEPIIAISISYFVMIIFMVPFVRWTKKVEFISRADAVKSAGLSMSSTVSGGIIFLLPYTALHIYGEQYSALVSLALSLAVLFTLIPRAMSYKFLPLIAAEFVDYKKLLQLELFCQFSKNIWKSLGLVLFIMLISVIPMQWFIPEIFFSEEAIYLYLVIMFLIYSMQVSFPYFCALQVAEDSKCSLIVNSISLIAVITLCVGLGFSGASLLIIISGSAAVYFARHFLMGLWLKSYDC